MAGPGLVLASALLSLLPPSLAYCTWAGANPYWTGAPTVEQVRVASYMEWWRWLLSLILPPFSSQQEHWQCGAQFINQQQITLITCSCSSQDTAVSACMQLRSAVLRDHAAGHITAGSVPAGPSHAATRVTLGQYSPLTRHPGHECSHGIHNILLSCPVHILAIYAQLSSPSPEILLCQIIFDLYCCTIP